jgi:putative ABC transport system permease protein
MRMFLFAILALRSLTRNKRRSLVNGIAVGFGVIALVVLQGFVNAIVQGIMENNVLSKVAPIQVFKAGYLGSDDPLKMTLPEDPELTNRIRAVPGVTAVAPRLDFDGMLSNGSESTMFAATAFDPALEYQVCPKRATYVSKGGRPLGQDDNNGALLGKAMAESLNLQRGSTVIMQAAGAHAGVNALDLSVVGFLPSLHPLEAKRVATVELRFAQELLRMKGSVTEYVVGIGDVKDADEIAQRVRTTLGSAYQVTTWKEMDPLAVNRTKMFQFLFGFIAIILFLLVATGIMNTTMMSVHERVREIGTMMAVGVRRRSISLLFLWEAILLSLASAAIGAAFGVAIIAYFALNGVSGGAPGADKVLLFPHVGTAFIAGVMAFTVVGTALSALFPAWKASRLRPVEALRAL